MHTHTSCELHIATRRSNKFLGTSVTFPRLALWMNVGAKRAVIK
jgi:hypothetical protein